MNTTAIVYVTPDKALSKRLLAMARHICQSAP